MYKLVSAKAYDITKKLAEEFRDMNEVPGERPFRPARIEALTADIERGRMISFRWSYAKIGSDKYRLNGKHTSHIFSNGIKIPEGAKPQAFVEVFECDSIDDALVLWSAYDPIISGRNLNDTLSTYISSNEGIKSVKRSVVKAALSGLVFEFFGYSQGKASINNFSKVHLLDGKEAFIQWLETVYEAKMFNRAVVVSSMWKMWNINKSDCSKFWTEVQNNSNPNPLSGSRYLRDELYTTTIHGKTPKRSRLLTPKELHIRCILSWNAWRRNQDVKFFRTNPDMKIPDAE